MTDFPRLLRELLTQFGGTRRDLARAVGVTPAGLTGLLRGAAPAVDVCLRLALVTGTPASLVLRAAGHGDIDELIQYLYGPAVKFRLVDGRLLTPLEEQRLKQWRRLPDDAAQALSLVLEAAAAPSRKRKRRRTAAR